MHLSDTLVAVASAPGGAARGVVRLSGPRAFELAAGVVELPLRDRRAFRCLLRLPGDLTLPAVVYAMPGPRSYTGEDIVEIHLPGSPPLLRFLTETLAARGARPAGPGEFTMRAHVNGRMDLAQAEAVQALIAAQDREEVRAARGQLEGDLSRPLRELEHGLLDLCADLEASLDFVEEDIRLISEPEARRRAEALRGRLFEILSGARVVEDARPTVVLRGLPNVGKTMLFNRLTGSDAIVSPVAGTTRDVLEGEMDGLRLRDAAGDQSAMGVDELAVVQGRRAAEEADLILLVVDATAPEEPPLPKDRPVLRVANKVDLLGPRPAPEGIRVSARTGEGLDRLRAELRARLRSSGGPGARVQVTLRQQAHLREALERLDAGRAVDAPELRALELRGALREIGAVTGRDVADDLLTRIFSRFCVGK